MSLSGVSSSTQFGSAVPSSDPGRFLSARPVRGGGMSLLPPAPPVASAGDNSPIVPEPQPGNTARSGRQSRDQLDKAVKDATQSDPSARIAVDKGSNAATFVAGEFRVDLPPGAAPREGAVAQSFLAAHGTLFGVADPAKQLKVVGVERDQLGFEHVKYQQVHDGLPVFGQQVIVHSQGQIVKSVGGRVTPNIVLDRAASLVPSDGSTALSAARRSLATSGISATGLREVTPRTLGIYTTADGLPHRAWSFELANVQGDGRWQYFVDADNGKVLDSWSTIHSALKRETFDAKNGQSQGKLARGEGQAPVDDAVVNAAHDNAKAVYDYYKENFNRDSLDNRGMKLTSTVHYGSKYNNAFWDGSKMTYGDGDGERFIPFALGADVVGHEMAHGVTEKTAGLRYFKQSGALNESWSDVFGNLIEKWDEARQNPGAAERDPKWLVGEQIFTPKVEGDGLRSMSTPGTGYAGDPQPGHMKDYKNISYDNGGVHINSGIPNKAAFEVAQKIGRDKLGAIWYRALTNYMTSGAQFSDAVNATVQSATDLYGSASAEVQAVKDSWVSVGLQPAAPKLR